MFLQLAAIYSRLNPLSISGNVELIQILNRLGHGISYSQLEEVDTALCLQKLAMTPEDGVPLPSNIYPGTNTVLAFDNIDRLEGTLCGSGTSLRVNGITVPPVTYGPENCGKDKEKILLCSRGESHNLQCRQASWAPAKKSEGR